MTETKKGQQVKRKSFLVLVALLFTLLFSAAFINLRAQVVFNHPVPTGASSDYTTYWTVPPDVSAVTVEAWGGGAGASLWNQPALDKGGQGGAYSKYVDYPVTPGDVLYISIGAGGPSGSYCGGNTTVTNGANLVLRARGGAFFFVNCVCYEYYIYPGTRCTADTSVNLVEAGQQTYTTAGGNAGGMAYGGGSGGVYPGGNGSVPGGGAASGAGTRQGASGRVKISYVITGIPSVTQSDPFHIYPNPAAGIYRLSMNNSLQKPEDIFVYDLLGNMIYKNSTPDGPDVSIDISGNAKGIYFIKVVSKGKTYLSRLAYL